MVIIIKMGHNEIHWAYIALNEAVNSGWYAGMFPLERQDAIFNFMSYEQNRKSMGVTMTESGHYYQDGS